MGRLRDRLRHAPSDTATRAISGGASKPAVGCGGRVVGVFAGLFFAGIGLVFVVLICRETWQAAQTRWWTQTPATVIESRVQQDADNHKEPYRPIVRYRYRLADGKQTEVVSDAFWNKGGGFVDYAAAQAIVDRYPAGATVTAYVHPRDPFRAVLEHRSPWIGLMVVLPLVFVLIGGVIVVASMKPSAAGTDATEAPNGLTGAISEQSKTGRGCAAGFFGVFFLAGLGVGIPAVILPAWRNVRAQNWPAAPCTIVSSTVREHRGSENTTYRPDVLYRYTFNGREYRSNRYSAESLGGSSKRASAYTIVQQYRPGRQSTCYVNPANPNEAVLSRAWTWRMLLIGLVPIGFMLVGAGGVYFSLRKRPGADGDINRPFSMRSADELTVMTRTRGGSSSSSARRGDGGGGGGGGGGGPLVLRPKARPAMKAVGALAVTIFWNGIVSIFVTIAIKAWLKGRPEVCMSLFMIPFVAIGLFLIGATIHSFLAIFNPVPEITLDHGDLALGDTTDVTWRFSGRFDRINRLRLRIEAREEATYRRGTDTTTDKRIFLEQDIVNTTRRSDIAAGKAVLAIPAKTMHSFASRNNKIVWELILHGDITGWPDVKLEFDLNVQPMATLPAMPPPPQEDEPAERAGAPGWSDTPTASDPVVPEPSEQTDADEKQEPTKPGDLGVIP